MVAKTRFLMATWMCLSVVFASSFDVPSVAFEDGFSPLFGYDNLVLDSSPPTTTSMASSAHPSNCPEITRPASSSPSICLTGTCTRRRTTSWTLGSRWGGQWRVQTNVYGNGSTDHGREERYLLPFDPTLEAHRYAVLWAPTRIIFCIDDAPIREVIRHPDMGGDFPAKPMAVYATIWDGSTWATDGGKYKVNYKYAPFMSQFSDLTLRGCRIDPALRVARDGAGAAAGECGLLGLVMADYAVMTPQKRAAMRAFRARHMTYTVCYDAVRYAAGPFPECDNSDEERASFSAWGESKTVVLRRRPRAPEPGYALTWQAAKVLQGSFVTDD